MGSDLQPIRAPPDPPITDEDAYYEDEFKRAEAIAEHLVRYPGNKLGLHELSDWGILLSEARKLTDANGVLVMPADDPSFIGSVKQAIRNHFAATKFLADCFTCDGNYMLHKVAKRILVMSEAQINCAACRADLRFQLENREKHIECDGCIFKRPADIVDAHVKKAFRWVMKCNPQFYYRESGIDEDEWQIAHEALYMFWWKFAPSYSKLMTKKALTR